MLRGALRSLATKAGTTDGAMDALLGMLKDKPKVCDYLTRTYLYRTRNKPPVLAANVWYRVVDSFAVTMMRYHTKQLNLLAPYIRNSEPAMHEPEPWANILWLGLAAPSGVLAALLQVCTHGAQGNPIACEYSTGGNFLHAVLQYRPQEVELLEDVLHALDHDKRSKGRALNQVHRVTQQTPLSLAIATQQPSMAQQLLLSGADPLVQCRHTRLIKPSAASGTKGSDKWRAATWTTTALHMLLGDSAGLVLGPVPWLRYVELQHLALQKAVELAGHEKQQALGLLDSRVNEAGEGVLHAAARCCCSWGTSFPLEVLTKARADFTKPNKHGVSPLLLLLRHAADGKLLPAAVQQGLLGERWKQKWTRQMLLEAVPTSLEGWDVQLLLQYMEQLPWGSMLPLLCDVSLYVVLIKEQRNLPVARLLLSKASMQQPKPGSAPAAARSKMQKLQT